MQPVSTWKKSALVLIVMLVVALVFIHTTRAPDLTYQGHSIDYWFERLPTNVHTVSFLDGPIPFPFSDPSRWTSDWCPAFDDFGASAAPYLVEKLTAQQGFFERHAIRLLLKAGAKRIPFRNAQAERARARTDRTRAIAALIYLKELSLETERQLVALKNDPEPELAVAADSILEKRNRAHFHCLPEDGALQLVDLRPTTER